MKTVLTITDLTRMQEGRVCIAGYDQAGKCIRPILPPPGILEESLFQNGRPVVYPFAVVEMDLLQATPKPPNCEDVRFDLPSLRFLHRLDPMAARTELLKSMFPNVAAIFGNRVCSDEGHYVLDGEGPRSLGTVKPNFVDKATYEQEAGGKWKYRLSFRDGANRTYRLTVTDLTWRYYIDRLRRGGATPAQIGDEMTSFVRGREVLLRVGLARGWDLHPDRCYLQITAVYTFPEYHQGRTFADLAHAVPGDPPDRVAAATSAGGRALPPPDAGSPGPAARQQPDRPRAARPAQSQAAREACATLVADYERSLCRLILYTVAASPVPLTAPALARVLKGGQSEFVVRNRLYEVASYGILPTFSRDHIAAVIATLGDHGLLKEDSAPEPGDWPTLKITGLGRSFLEGAQATPIPFLARLAKPDMVSLNAPDEALFESLRSLRRELTASTGLPPYTVCHDSVLRELARRKPASATELLEVRGIGSRFVAKYGEPFLERIGVQANRS